MESVSKEIGVSKESLTESWKKGIIDFELGRVPEEEFWRIVLDDLEVNYDWGKLNKIVLDHFRPIGNPKKTLEELRKNYVLGMVSNQTDWIDELNEKYGFKKYFDHYLISKEVSLRKPSKEIFNLLLERCKLKPEEVVFIDDTASYEENVKILGIDFINFKNPSQLINELEERGIK